MKNITILNDELSLLKAGKSALVNELNNVTNKLNEINDEVFEAEDKLKELREITKDESTRYEDLLTRVVFVKEELSSLSGRLTTDRTSLETLKFKNSQEDKLHQGRRKELEDTCSGLVTKIGELKDIHDKNFNIYSNIKSDGEKELRDIDMKKQINEKELALITLELGKKQEEDKRMTKDRLKREDKIRLREATLEIKIRVQEKREEDLITATRDIAIVYSRLKELYLKVDPTIDLDRIIKQL